MNQNLEILLTQTNIKWEREYKFHPTRKFRFDFAIPEKKLAIEYEGGTFSGGGHVRGAHYSSDCHKYNEAAIMGWRVLRFTSDMLRLTPAIVLNQIQEALK